MLFMSVYTYDPGNRDEILKRRAGSLFTPEGAKLVGQWFAASGGRVFTLYETDDGLSAAKWAHAWNDLGKFETFTVVEIDEFMKAMAAAQG
jgi:hypothetical protein